MGDDLALQASDISWVVKLAGIVLGDRFSSRIKSHKIVMHATEAIVWASKLFDKRSRQSRANSQRKQSYGDDFCRPYALSFAGYGFDGFSGHSLPIGYTTSLPFASVRRHRSGNFLVAGVL